MIDLCRVVCHNAFQGARAYGYIQQHHWPPSPLQGSTKNLPVSKLPWMDGQSHRINVPGPRHSAGKDIISRLLDKEENTRLGSKTGASEVKQHKWFSKINWGLLRNTEPPVSCATWVARFTTATCRFVPLLPRPWLDSQHMVLFHFCT